jgi:hypothetical protein
MGKAAKAHRAKVAKRNVNVKVQEKRMQKLWQEAFEEQMNAMKEKFASMSGETITGDTIDRSNITEDKDDDEKMKKEFLDFFSHENGLKVANEVVKNFGQNLITEEDLKDLGNEIKEKMKNFSEDQTTHENEEVFENEKPLIERIKNSKNVLESLINEDKEGLEIIQKFDELLKIIKKTDDSEENSKGNEPAEPISGDQTV